MICPSCKAENQPDSRFCNKCATPLPSDVAEAAPSHTQTMMTPYADLVRGTVFAGRYEIIEDLGKGGMGKVYKAFDQKIKEVVALKLIKPEIGFNEKAIERFKNELRFARKISHRNVCRLYDLGEFGLAHFITMEYVEGEDLKNFVRRSGQITTPKALSIAAQICEGLAEAHRLGVVHRDLKPQNVMIDSDGNVRILDFGLARFMEADGVTGSGVMLGTPEYMSPEQVDLKEIDVRSDIYSLGVIMYEMVTGRVPFQGETPISIAIKHKSERPKDSREINPLVPDAMAKAILKCLEKDREKRYQSADELLQDLRRIEEDLPTAIKEISRAEPRGSREITVKFQLKKIMIPGLILIFGAMIAVLAVLRTARKAGPDTRASHVTRVAERKGGLVAPQAPGGDAPGRFSGTATSELWAKLGGELSKYLNTMDGRDVKEIERLADNVKGYLPEKGPSVDAWHNIIDRIGKQKKLEDQGKSGKAEPGAADVRGDMQKLLSLVAERQSAQRAKELTTAARVEAQPKVNVDKNLLFRLTRYEETNADEAFAKNDYSGAKALYAILGKLYALCPRCKDDQSSVAALQEFISGLKKEIEQQSPAAVDPWMSEYAREIENQAVEFLAKKNLENAGGAYIRAAFLYEKIIETGTGQSQS